MPPVGGVPGSCVQPSKAAWAPFALLRDREGGLGDRVAAQWSWVSLCHWGLWICSLSLSSWGAVGSFVWLSELPGWDQNVLSGLCWVLLGPWALAFLACYWLNTHVFTFSLVFAVSYSHVTTRCVDVQALVALIGVGVSSLHGTPHCLVLFLCSCLRNNQILDSLWCVLPSLKVSGLLDVGFW